MTSHVSLTYDVICLFLFPMSSHVTLTYTSAGSFAYIWRHMFLSPTYNVTCLLPMTSHVSLSYDVTCLLPMTERRMGSVSLVPAILEATHLYQPLSARPTAASRRSPPPPPLRGWPSLIQLGRTQERLSYSATKTRQWTFIRDILTWADKHPLASYKPMN